MRSATMMLICGLLALAGCASASARRPPDALGAATRAQIANLRMALEAFELDCGRYPTEQEGLQALIAGAGIRGWAGPYLKGRPALLDNWGNALRYSCPEGKAYRLISAGPDGKLGTADDIQQEP